MTVEPWQSNRMPTGTGAVLSDNGLYRYRLWRNWSPRPHMVWIMLNPSTADAELDDPTIRRCISFAKREACGGIEVINLYALRTTKPAHLLDHPDPEGPENLDHWYGVLLNHQGPIVAAWGAWPSAHQPPLAGSTARYMVERRHWLCLGRTKHGDPRHPLYVKGDTPLVAL